MTAADADRLKARLGRLERIQELLISEIRRLQGVVEPNRSPLIDEIDALLRKG
jgi:hypothetical protein